VTFPWDRPDWQMTDVVIFCIAHTARAEDALRLYAELRRRAPHLDIFAMTPPLRVYLERAAERRGEAPLPLPRLFWWRVTTLRPVVERVRRTLREWLGNGPRQAFDPHGGRSFGAWLREGEGESRRWEEKTDGWLRGRDEDDGW
jgi:hypothetical protein